MTIDSGDGGAVRKLQRPVHSMITLTVRQLSDRELTAWAMYLQGYGLGIIADTLHVEQDEAYRLMQAGRKKQATD